jgi:hypothetical protein
LLQEKTAQVRVVKQLTASLISLKILLAEENNMADGLLSQLLKTPQQIRQEQLDRIRQESLLGVRAQQPISGAMSALPSIYQNFTNQALARQGTDIAQAFRGATQGIGGMLGAVGAPELGRSVSQLSVSPEERQASAAQQALQGVVPSDPASLEAAAQRLQQLGLTAAAQQLVERARILRQRTKDTDTADVRTFKFYQELSPEDRELFAEALGRGARMRDLGGEILVINPDGSTERIPKSIPPAQTPEAVGEREAAKVEGKTTAEKRLAAPQEIERLSQMITNIDELTMMPGFESAVGLSSVLYTVPGGASADFEAKLEQLQAQAFLNQFDQLRGAGAITEREGEAAKAALLALKLTMSEEAFLKELRKVKGILRKGQQALENLFQDGDAKGTPPARSVDIQPSDQQGTPVVIRRYNPATGSIE